MSFKLGPNTVVNSSRKLFVDSSKFSATFTNSDRPTDASTGDVIYNRDENVLQIWTGSAWVNIVETGEEYFIDDDITTILNVPATCNTIRIAGVGAGGNSSYVNSTTGGRGGGGGAGNLSGYDYPGAPLRNSTIYVSTLSDAVVRRISASGTIIFDARSGTPGPSGGNGGVMTTGPGNNGGSGGVGGPRFVAGTPGVGASNAGAGGGGGGGYGDSSPPIPGEPGGNGGDVSVSNTIQPFGTGPAPSWTFSSGSGGSGGTSQGAGQNSSGQGGPGSPVFYGGGGGGGGGGVVLNGTAYGGGGGGIAAYGIQTTVPGGGAFIIVQFI
jgi:hypothetical protein